MFLFHGKKAGDILPQMAQRLRKAFAFLAKSLRSLR
jgi:hypothetical protein